MNTMLKADVDGRQQGQFSRLDQSFGSEHSAFVAS